MENRPPLPADLPPELGRALKEVTDVTGRFVAVQLTHEREMRAIMRHWIVLIAMAGLLFGATVYLLVYVTQTIRRLEEQCPKLNAPLSSATPTAPSWSTASASSNRS